MKTANTIKLAITAVALLLIPRRSSRQADAITPPKTTQTGKPTHDTVN